MQGVVILAQSLGEALWSQLHWHLFSLTSAFLSFLASLTHTFSLAHTRLSASCVCNRDVCRSLRVLTPLCSVSTTPYPTVHTLQPRLRGFWRRRHGRPGSY